MSLKKMLFACFSSERFTLSELRNALLVCLMSCATDQFVGEWCATSRGRGVIITYRMLLLQLVRTQGRRGRFGIPLSEIVGRQMG